MARKEDCIAVFDSGVGGISVLRELMALMPGENFLYFGDSANAPYGSRTTEDVRRLTLHHAQRLLSRDVKALVIACNTATAAAIEDLRQQYPDMLVIGIEPAIKPAVDRFPRGRIGIMATEVTLREEKLERLLAQFPQTQVQRIAAPGLVERIEAGLADARETEVFLRDILAPYAGKLDALVLGCTHYPFVKDALRAVLGEDVCLFDGGEGTARQTQRCLARENLLLEGSGSVQIENSLQNSEIISLCCRLLEY